MDSHDLSAFLPPPAAPGPEELGDEEMAELANDPDAAEDEDEDPPKRQLYDEDDDDDEDDDEEDDEQVGPKKKKQVTQIFVSN
jgi:hypothetical protein